MCINEVRQYSQYVSEVIISITVAAKAHTYVRSTICRALIDIGVTRSCISKEY